METPPQSRPVGHPGQTVSPNRSEEKERVLHSATTIPETITAQHEPEPGATAVFRCDASPRIGAGHVYRCMALADALVRLGWHCRFLVGPETIPTVPALRDAGLEALTTTGDPADEIAALTIGRAHVRTPVTHAHIVCRLLPDQKTNK